MAKQVENRVVEMEFKNKDFEKAVSVTMKSLEELNKKIDDLNKINTEGFDNLSKAANNVKFDTLFDNIDRLQDRLTTLGGKFVSRIQDEIVNIGVNAFQSAANGLERAYDNVTSTIVNKGKTRAQNLAQAKFQLEALGVSWNKVYDDMDYAVTGTAYGIDEAARAASQFAASNVNLGKDMKAALRGISGVAAMTGRGYSEIAQIFTTVAGTGRAMNGELNRIAERGLNAKKAIADFINETDYFGNGIRVTQEQIYDFAKDGEISFDLFSKAMDHAFGEHATKANDLFTGALDNTKAALGRIGERFATPIYEDLRQILVALIPVINDFKKSLDPVVNSVTAVTGNIKDLIVNGLEKLHGAFLEEDSFTFDFFGNVVDAKEVLMDALTHIGDLINGISDGINSNLFLNIIWNIVEGLKAVKDGFVDVFGELTGTDISSAIYRFTDLTKELMLDEDTLSNIRSIVGGIAAVFDMVYKTVSSLWKTGIKPMLIMISPALGDILNTAGSLGEALKSLNEAYDPLPYMHNFFEQLRGHIFPFVEEIKKVFMSIKDFFVQLTGIHDISSLFAQMDKLAGDLHLADIFYGIAGAIMYAFDTLKNFIEMLNGNVGFKEYVKQLTEQNTVLSWVKDKFTAIKTTLDDLFSKKITLSQALGLDKLKQHFEWLNPLLETFKEHYKSIFEANEVDIKSLPFIDQFVYNLKESIKNLDFDDIFGMIGAGFYAYFIKKSIEIKSAIAKTFGNFVDTFQKLADGITGSLVKMSKETNASKILKIAGAIALLAGSILLLGKMNTDELMQGIGAISLLAIGLAVLTKVLSKVLTTTEKTKREVDSLSDDKTTTTKTRGRGKNKITRVVEKLGATITETKEEVERTIKDISSVPALILSFGAAVFLIGSAIAKIAKYADGDGTIENIMVLMGIIVAIMSITIYKLAELTSLGDLDADALMAIAKTFLFLGIAIKLIATSIAEIAAVVALANDGGYSVLVAVGSLLAMLAALLGVVYGLTVIQAKMAVAAPVVLSMAGSMAIIALGLSLLTLPIISIAATTAILGENGIKLMWNSVGIIAALALVIGAIVVGFGAINSAMVGSAPGMLAGAASMLIIAIAINALLIPLAAITSIAAVDINSLVNATAVIGALTLLMFAVVTLFGALGGATGGIAAAGMLAGAAAMWIIAKAMQAMLVPIATLALLESQMPNGLGGVFKDIAIGLGLLAAAGVVVELIAPAFIILEGFLTSVGVSAWLVGTAIKGAGEGVLFFVSALALLQSINFDTLAQKIGEAGAAMIHGFTTALTGGIPDIQSGFVALIAAGAGAITASAGMIAEACFVLLEDVINAIDKHAQEIGFHLGHALGDITFYAFLGLGGSIGDIIARAFGVEDTMISDFLMDKFLPKKDDNSLAKKVADLFNFTGKKETKESAQKTGKEMSDETVNAYEENLNSTENKQKIGNSTSDLVSSVGSYIDTNEIKESFGVPGEASIDGLSEKLGIKNGQSLEAKDLADAFGGTYVDQIASYEKDAEDAGTKLGRAPIKGVAKAQDSHSPSKEALRLGNYFIDGYLMGLDSSDPANTAKSVALSVVSAFSSIENSAKSTLFDPLNEAVANMAAVASSDMDLTPTISPILDMSDVQSGFSSLNSMFSSSRSIALAGEVSDLNTANRLLSLQIQNDDREGTNENINSLGSKLEKLGDAIMNRQIVLDSGELVGGLVDPMDRSFGVRAIRAQRGG